VPDVHLSTHRRGPASADEVAITTSFERLITWSRRVTPRGLSASTITTLDTLSYAGPLRISDLADREGMTQPGMTTLVNRLEHDGLAIRTTDPSDGRAALVAITESGRARVSAYRAMRAGLIGDRLAALDPGDQRALRAAVAAIERLTADVRTPAAGTSDVQSSQESGQPG
jgi:DNA-binding MarR family transcriptional regulator